MKQETCFILLLLFTINVGSSNSYAHGVKGSFSKSYSGSSSSASASSSAFSGSLSSDVNNPNNHLQSGSAAFSSAFANGGFNGASAKAGLDDYSGSGAYSGSETSFARLQSGSGAFSSSGSFSGLDSKSQAGSGSNSNFESDINKSRLGSHNAGQVLTPYSVSNSEAISNSKLDNSQGVSNNIRPHLISVTSGYSGLNSEVFDKGCGGGEPEINQGCGLLKNQKFYKGPETVLGLKGQEQKIQPNTIFQVNKADDTGATGNNIRYNGNNNNSPSKIMPNDFQIPDEFAPKIPYQGSSKPQFPGPQGNIHDYKPAQAGDNGSSSWTPHKQNIPPIPQNSQIPQVPNYGQSGSNEDSYAESDHGFFNPGKCKNCKGPFPGPIGNIHDFKPVQKNGGGPPGWVPKEQTQPPLVRPSLDLINTFPGSPGNIYDSKPVTQRNKIPAGVIPVIVGFPNYNQGFPNKPNYQPKPGSIAVSVMGQLPGPTDSINSNKPIIQQFPVFPAPIFYNQKPIELTPDLINKFPGEPGNIHDSKPVDHHKCSNRQCSYQPNVATGSVNARPSLPDCTSGQCDEYGGRLGCHGDDCFGPGKKPYYLNNESKHNIQANTDSNKENGNINNNFNGPSSYKPNCSNGLCNTDVTNQPQQPYNGKPGTKCPGPQCTSPGSYKPDCSRGQCNIGESYQHVELEKNCHGPKCSTSSSYKPDCLTDQCNIDGIYQPENPISGSPGKICSGSQCLDNKKPHSTQPNTPQPGQINIDLSQHQNDYDDSVLDFNIDVRQKPDSPVKNLPQSIIKTECSEKNCNNDQNGYSYVNSNSNANSNNAHEEKVDIQIDRKPDSIPNYIPSEVEFSKKTDPPKPEYLTTPKPKEKKTSMDFLLPGNKPYQHHHVKLHPNPSLGYSHQPTTSGTYYACTGESCPLPKPNMPQPNLSQIDKECQEGNCENIPINNNFVTSCQGDQCGNPEIKLVCQGSRCGAGAHFIPIGNNRPSMPVKVNVPYQNNQDILRTVNPENKLMGLYSGSNSNAETKIYKETLNKEINLPDSGLSVVENSSELFKDFNNEQKNQDSTGLNGDCLKGTCQFPLGSNSGFVSGNVNIQKPNGEQVSVVDIHIPNNHPGQPCRGNNCDYSGANLGTYSENSGAYSGNSGYYSKNLEAENAGAYVGHSETGNSGTHIGHSVGQPCGNGNCGHGINGVQLGGHSGTHSGSYSGSTNSEEVKGGCKTCGRIPVNGGTPVGGTGSGAFSGSSAFGSYSSGAYSGSHSGSYSSGIPAGSEAALKSFNYHLIADRLKENGFQGGIPGVFGNAGSFAQSGSSSSSFGPSAFSGSYSSAGSTSY